MHKESFQQMNAVASSKTAMLPALNLGTFTGWLESISNPEKESNYLKLDAP